MNTSLPQSIEAYLKEAGFTQTEMLILRKLLEHNSLTIRELATKMGTSTGLIDQAMKKLMSKNIIKREMSNGHPVYQIHSLDAVVQWVKTDMKGRKETLEKRQENFETFIATLKVDKGRPDMEHFSGEEGVQKAYDKLLEVGGEVLTMMPVLYLAEDDPLRAFRVDLFRRRQVRKIFQRVLATDSPLARRFQSRDMFEYRKTLLVPESQLPLTFEKTIAGGTVAYIDQKNLNACFLNFPEIAKTERATFDALWNRTLSDEKSGNGPASAAATPTVVPLSTRIFSKLREFFLGKRSIVALIIFALLSGILTFGLYKTNRDLNLERLKEKVQAVAITGSLQFDALDVNAIWNPEDIARPQYAKLVATLNLIRRSNKDIQNAYLMRKTDDPWKWKFVADADSLDPSVTKDLNNDGNFDSADQLSYPGDLYDISPYPWSVDAFAKPIVDPKPITDQWGTFITSTAQIKNLSGETVAVLGVDMLASNLDRLSAASFTPLYAFIGFFALFMIIRFWSENRSLMEECLEEMRKNVRKTVLWVLFLATLFYGIIFVFQQYHKKLLIEQTGERLMAIAVTAASEFDPKDLEQLHWAKDMKTEAYQRVFKRLNEIRNRNSDVTYAYIMRPTDDEGMFEFVADADANWNLPSQIHSNIEDIGPFTEDDENAFPGFMYYDLDGFFRDGMKKSSFTPLIIDQWGKFTSATSPIYDSNGHVVALLGLDIDLEN